MWQRGQEPYAVGPSSLPPVLSNDEALEIAASDPDDISNPNVGKLAAHAELPGGGVGNLQRLGDLVKGQKAIY